MKTQETLRNTSASDRSFEIAVWIIGILVFVFFLITADASAKNPQFNEGLLQTGMNENKSQITEYDFEEEAYVEDIPCNTKYIAANSLYNDAISTSFEFEEETYINDVPFSTEKYAVLANYTKSISVDYKIADESYIDDIPFSTEQMASEYNYKTTINQEFEMTEEDYIDDIPFNTCQVVAQAKHGRSSVLFARKK